MQDLRAITGGGRPWAGPPPIEPAAGAAARRVLLRALAELDGPGAGGIMVPPEDRRAAFAVQLDLAAPEPPAAARGRAVYRLAAAAGIFLEGLHRPVDLRV